MRNGDSAVAASERSSNETGRSTTAPFISKTKFLPVLQCHKLLWHAYNAKDLIPEPDAATVANFEQSHEVGALVKKMFPDGTEIGDGIFDLDETIRLTLCGATLMTAAVWLRQEHLPVTLQTVAQPPCPNIHTKRRCYEQRN